MGQGWGLRVWAAEMSKANSSLEFKFNKSKTV